MVISPDHRVAYVKKAHLVIRMLEIRLGQPVLMQVLNKLLVLARLSAVSNLYCSGESILNLGPICLDQSSSDSSNGLNSIQSQCLTKTTSHTKFSIPPGTDFAHASCPHDLVDREFKTGDTEELARSGKRASVCLVKGPASASLDTGILLSGASPNEDLLSPSITK
ncbi:unnamed protein product [Protopolystoma xenopodis]|uniref:Uncharacterized protein n=1 Tax=Protopolystoma xenopodis TaxID=117903 RepID=A0A3S5A0K1_9PLAT|nr:unnamed protein product [Protopolystoma xenopodis]